MAEQSKNDALMDAIASHNLKAVQNCLTNGADPNYFRHNEILFPNASGQPTTPLRLVMFCISDALLEENDLKQFAEIAKLLLLHGADPEPAMQIAELRYGKYDPDAEQNSFTDVWKIIANGK